MQPGQDNNIFKGLVEQSITVKEFRNIEKIRKCLQSTTLVYQVNV